VWFYTHKSFAKMNEGRNMKNGIGMQIANPNLVIQKWTLEKRMNWDPETPLKEIL
jgi:hypothetical protein